MAQNKHYESNDDDIKPKINVQEMEMILEKFYGLRGGELKKMAGYDDLNYHYIAPKVNNNPNIETLCPVGYVLKIMNSEDSKLNALCEGQNSMMLFLRENNIPSPRPVKNLFGEYYVKQKFPQKATGNEIQKEHIVRLSEFQTGIILKNVPKSYSIFYQLGIFLAKLDEVLKRFSHSVYKSHYSIWHLGSVPKIKSMTHIVKEASRRHLVETIVDEFIQTVLTKKDLEKGIIHGDFNEHNILVSQNENGEWKVSAILDFGDSHQSNYLFELAIAMCYMMFECKRHHLDPLTGAGHLLSGYLTICPALKLDYTLLKVCICARISQSLVLGLKSFSLYPENTYVLDSQEMGWPLVEELWKYSIEEITEAWDSVIHSNHIDNSIIHNI